MTTATRDARIAELWQNGQGMKQAAIGKKYGISGARVNQILAKHRRTPKIQVFNGLGNPVKQARVTFTEGGAVASTAPAWLWERITAGLQSEVMHGRNGNLERLEEAAKWLKQGVTA